MDATLSMPRPIQLLGGVLCLAFSLACGEPSADVSDPSHYSKGGVDFDYPGNWDVSEDEDLGDGVRYLIVESPGNALLLMNLIPKDMAPDIQGFGTELAKAAKEETPIGDVSASKFGDTYSLGNYTAMKEDFSISVMGQTVPHTRTYHHRLAEDTACFLTSQVANEDEDEVAQGFTQIVESFLSNGK